MKKIYLPVLAVLILTGCSKDFLKHYDDRIVGSWRITDVNRIGIGGSSSDLIFGEGVFVFNDDGSLQYTDADGNVSSGYWDIQKRKVNNDLIRTLHIEAVDFNTQRVRGEFYDEMNFRSTDHFVAKINTSLRTFVTHFRR
jgi:hypothetical protein